MTLTSAPVEALSSVTDLPPRLGIHTWVPSEYRVTASLKPWLDPVMTLTSAPVEALSSVTEFLSVLATHTSVPSEDNEAGPKNPHPKTRGPLKPAAAPGSA